MNKKGDKSMIYKKYPETPDFDGLTKLLNTQAQLMHEYGSEGIETILKKAETALMNTFEELKTLPIDKKMAAQEPNGLDEIKKLRPSGPRKIWTNLDEETYRKKLLGAFYARMSGCILGSIVEFWPIKNMENWAKHIGDAFPPEIYWSKALMPNELRYNFSPQSAYTKDGMDGVPVDDDIIYTLLGLLIAEDHGIDFTVKDVAEAWLKYLPYACTAEEIALNNLKKGIKPELAGEIDNPMCQWIGADIRSDPFAYMAPGLPEKAASMAYYDAYISHRRNGIYGEMFFSAAQAAAFTVEDPIEAIKIGLTEIPKDCALSKEVIWALNAGTDIKNYRDARTAVDERYKGMHPVHTINNAVLTIWGLMIGGLDVTKVLSETVAMGLDNDCTAATAGSIVGAVVGIDGVPEKWYKNFNNKVHSYLIDQSEFKIDDLINRFTIQASKNF